MFSSTLGRTRRSRRRFRRGTNVSVFSSPSQFVFHKLGFWLDFSLSCLSGGAVLFYLISLFMLFSCPSVFFFFSSSTCLSFLFTFLRLLIMFFISSFLFIGLWCYCSFSFFRSFFLVHLTSTFILLYPTEQPSAILHHPSLWHLMSPPLRSSEAAADANN